jgi:hypothetical protein
MQKSTIMEKVNSLQSKLTQDFIDHCNLNDINLIQWYRWQVHLIWEQRNIHRKLEKGLKYKKK